MEVKDFLLMQMGGSPDHSSANAALSSHLSQVGPLSSTKEGSGIKKGKAMNIEELRINKQLLNEISRKKKEK